MAFPIKPMLPPSPQDHLLGPGAFFIFGTVSKLMFKTKIEGRKKAKKGKKYNFLTSQQLHINLAKWLFY